MQLFSHELKKTSLAALFFLFFLWGALTCLNTLIIPHLEKLFVFKEGTSFGFANAFFGSYLLMAIPSAFLIRAVQYKKSIILGLLISALGTNLFFFASKFVSYTLFIAGFVILATGITLIQVAANTFISILGDKNHGAGRLSLAQAINSLGYVMVLSVTFNPIFTGHDSIVYNARNIQQPYLIISILIIIASLLYTQLQFPSNRLKTDQKNGPLFSRDRGLYIAAAGIFLYVGAELTIARMIQFSYSETYSAGIITIMLLCYWGGMMIGRFTGGPVFKFLSPVLVLQANALLCMLIVVAALFLPAGAMIWLLVVLGLFNAIMFPVLFAGGLNLSGNPSCFDGSVLIMAISGGALFPALHEQITARYGSEMSLLVLGLSYLLISAAGYYLFRQLSTGKAVSGSPDLVSGDRQAVKKVN